MAESAYREYDNVNQFALDKLMELSDEALDRLIEAAERSIRGKQK